MFQLFRSHFCHTGECFRCFAVIMDTFQIVIVQVGVAGEEGREDVFDGVGSIGLLRYVKTCASPLYSASKDDSCAASTGALLFDDDLLFNPALQLGHMGDDANQPVPIGEGG